MQKIHFIGIKGVGMAALAIYAKERGFEVTGSDVADNFITQKILDQTGIPVLNFNQDNLKEQPNIVVVSAAYDKNHPEVKEAKKRHLEILTYSEALGFFSKDSQVIAVAGIHGKTTITSLIAYLLEKAGLDPSYIIGAGEVFSLKSIAHYGKGNY